VGSRRAGTTTSADDDDDDDNDEDPAAAAAAEKTAVTAAKADSCYRVLYQVGGQLSLHSWVFKTKRSK
jgi:hypothetical protein